LSSNDSYIYGIFHLGKVADLTLGGSFSHVEGEHRELAPFLDNTFKKDRLNPKIGFISNPIEDLTLRAAYFETLAKSTFEDNILIEPSMVAGINQRFTDDSATQARNLGAGVDYKIGALSYFGVEALRRHTVHPYYEAKSFFIVNYDDMTLAPRLGEADPWDYHRNENFIKAYYSQVWTPKLVSNIDYSFSRFDATDPEINDDVKLHKTSAELRYFSVTGLFPFINATWRDQTHKGNFLAQDGTSAFWTLDVGLGYRIPERHGAVFLKIENILDEDFVYYQGFGLEPLVHSGIGFSLNASFNF
ncbi:MAG: TonB-dependent receptor, partial [SAR324 cluster bacterium]|nr:TonB-dependent receptor [SAR324 cluster bacterium]